jgi:hypothetical protein
VMWHMAQAADATAGQAGCLQHHPQCGTSKHMCYKAHADCTFCGEGHRQGRGSHVPGVLAVPEEQGSQATSSSRAGHSRAGTQVLPCACGFGWPATSFFRGARVPAHHHRQVNQVVCSSPSKKHGGQHVCGCLHLQLGVARFGVPETVTTDRGTQFTSAL